MVAQAGPKNIEDFLWNIHTVLVAEGPMPLDNLKEAYLKRLGHKCTVERFLVVGDGGLAATFKRIPHIVKLSMQDGAQLVRASLPEDTTRQKLAEADLAYRRELAKKNELAKAKALAAKAAPAAAAKARPSNAAPVQRSPPAAGTATEAASPGGAAEAAVAASPAKADAPPAKAEGGKRPAPASEGAAAPDAKRPRTADEEKLAKMLVQGVMRILQTRVQNGKGPLPLSELEEEFKAHWKVAFNYAQAGESDAITFLQKYPHKIELQNDGGAWMAKPAKMPETAASQTASPAAGTEASPAAATAPAHAGTNDATPKRPAPATAEGASPAGGDAKRPRTADEEKLARMLVQGVVKIVQTRVQNGKGPLPLSELEDEFKAHWKVPFNYAQAGESDAIGFLQKYPNKIELQNDGGAWTVRLTKKEMEKVKAPPATASAPADPAPANAKAPPPPSSAVQEAPPSAPPPKAGSAAPAPEAVATANATSHSEAGQATSKSAARVARKSPGPTPRPTAMEDFLWNLHSAVEAHEGPLPVEQMREQYLKHLGHECPIERFLVVNEHGLASTLRRIPHLLTVFVEKDGGVQMLKVASPGITKEQLVEKDQAYRKQLRERAAAAKAEAADGAAQVAKKAPPAKASPTVRNVDGQEQSTSQNATHEAGQAATEALPNLAREAAEVLATMREALAKQEALVGALNKLCSASSQP